MSVEIIRASRIFSGQYAVREVTSNISEGSMAAVLGANGAGKSTLLRMIAGWLPASSGRVQILGQRIDPNQISVRRNVLLLDEPRQHDGKVIASIVEVVNDCAAVRPGIEDEVAEWMERLDLVGIYNRRSRNVSKGQRYKVAMIGLFVVRPKVWLLDEPFSCGLDAGGLQILEDEMKRHAKEGGTVVFSSQWPEHAMRLADQVLVLDDGVLMLDAAPTDRINPDLLHSAPPALTAVLNGLSDGR